MSIVDDKHVQENSNSSCTIYHGIEFASIERLIELYSEALTGGQVEFSDSTLAVNPLRNNWWQQLSAGACYSGSINIAVPASFMEHKSYEENFNWYKSLVTQQVAHFEFGSFDFNFYSNSNLFENRRFKLHSSKKHAHSFEKFFSLFKDPVLALYIFVATENIRINYLVKNNYPGLKPSYQAMQESLSMMENPVTQRQAFCYYLERLEYDAASVMYNNNLSEQLKAAGQIVNCLCMTSAAIEDSAEAAIRIYDIAKTIPEKAFFSASIGRISASSGSPDNIQGQEFTGDFNADGLKLNLALSSSKAQDSSIPMTAEEMRKLEDSNLAFSAIQDTFSLPSTGLSVADLPRGINVAGFSQSKYNQAQRYSPDTISASHIADASEQINYYDEWDFRTGGYASRYCCVREKVLKEGTNDFYQTTLKNHQLLINEIKRQFEKLPDEMLLKVKNLDDGDEFDMDLIIDQVAERRAGQTPSGKIYWKKRKIQRDVAALFLLDMSGSTADHVSRKQSTMQYDDSIKYNFMKFFTQPGRRIIDLEKESAVLMMHALEELGDSYGVYGFSGHGRANVQFLVIKDFKENFNEKVKRRVDMISPFHGTRMGPAIRHATMKLDGFGSPFKILFLISDGYPQDQMYGHSDDDKEYAIHDTRKALLEAVKKNITPFCLTVDSAGNDYLRTMCSDIGYEVLEDIEMLPHRLPALYNKLSS